jgi:23S rRNA U2552 (ribose-2'-O)-methylase RlmE/FtsJ
MYYYYLPKHNNAITHLNLSDLSQHNTPFISKTLYDYLKDYKMQIDNYENEWDNTKKYTNPYEFIHTPVPNSKSVSTIKPLSRSFFKMIEMIKFFNLINNQSKMKSFHLAEGPGGFIEALVFIRNNKEDQYFGMTLIDEDINVPSWKKTKSFIQNTPNFIIENGPTNTGDLFKVENLIYCKETYRNSIDFITADGGFDFSENFNNQETLVSKLLIAEVCFALCMQKKNGCFILKIFDIMTKITIDLIYILTCFYDDISICKPQTSRIANSEKYIICKGFKINQNNEIFLKDIIKQFSNIMATENFNSIISEKHSLCLINKIEEINAIFGQQQIENISYTLNLITNRAKQERIETLKRNNIQKSIQWCEKYNIPHEKLIVNENIFLTKSF